MTRAFASVFDDFEIFTSHPDFPRHVNEHAVLIPPDTEGFAIVAGVRNPFARELSLYFWRTRVGTISGLRFVEYMQAQLTRTPADDCVRRTFGTQSQFMEGLPATLVRYEELPDSFYRLNCLQGRSVILPCARQTRSAFYRLADYYDDETMDLVRTYAAADFVNYGYDPNLLPSD